MKNNNSNAVSVYRMNRIDERFQVGESMGGNDLFGGISDSLLRDGVKSVGKNALDIALNDAFMYGCGCVVINENCDGEIMLNNYNGVIDEKN